MTPLFADPLVCQEFVELVTDHLEGTLSRRDRRRMNTHLKACDGCTEYLESMRLTVRSMGVLPPEPIDEHVREHLLAAFLDLRSGGSRGN